MGPTTEELAIFDEVSALGQKLWDRSKQVDGLTTDPKMLSVMLYRRLWSNHRGYIVLYKERLNLESDIILRSGLEAGICIAANFRLREHFVALMRADAAFTVAGQIKLHRADGDADMVREGEANLRMLTQGLPNGMKPAKLDWATLASHGGVDRLYGFYRMLSGISSHVTGVSLLRGVVVDDSDSLQQQWTQIGRKMHPMMMAGATLQGSLIHGGMLDDDEIVRSALELTGRMNVISLEWPGAETP